VFQLSVISYQCFSDQLISYTQEGNKLDFLRNKNNLSSYTQEGNKLDFLRNKNHLLKPQRGEINIAWGSAPGNPSYDHVEYTEKPQRGEINIAWGNAPGNPSYAHVEYISYQLSVISYQ
jgi:hypothetical protein